MEKLLAGLILTLIFGLGSLAIGAAPAGKIRVLLVAGNEPGESHDYVHNPAYLIQALDGTERFTFTRLTADAKKPVSDFLDGLSELKRADFDVVITYLYKYADRNGAAQRIIDFVHAGGGLVAVHGSSGVFMDNPAWLQMLGGRFTGHTHGKYTIDLLVPTHPVLAGLPASFEVEDEDYFHRILPGTERTVLGVIRHRPQGDRPDKNNDSIWTCEAGAGRVFYTALGHGRATWQNPIWQKMIAQAICWTARRPEAIDLPPTTAEKPGAKASAP